MRDRKVDKRYSEIAAKIEIDAWLNDEIER